MEAGSGQKGSAGWASWVAFAGLMMMLIGIFDIIGGLGAVFSDTYFATIQEGELLLTDYTGWGILMMVFGVLLIAAGWGLINGSGWARVFAIVLIFLHAAGHVAYFPAAPFWSLLIILIDVFILFALTVRWDSAQRAL